jgi:DNA repair protein RAD57
MTDLSYVLPTFPLHPYTRLIPSLEKHKISTTDLLTLNAAEISKRAHLPLLEVRRLCRDVLGALQHDLGVGSAEEKDGDSLCLDSSPMLEKRVDDGTKAEGSEQMGARALRMTGVELVEKRWETISTLDESLDAALGGGVPVGYITEVTGER